MAIDVVKVVISRATRVNGGPVELLVDVTARQDVDEVRARLGRTTAELGAMYQGECQTIALLGADVDSEVQITVSFLLDGARDEIIRSATIVDLDPAKSRVESLFSPGAVADGTMFVGRAQDRDYLRLWYGGVHARNVTTRLLTGPREIGKTSLIKSMFGDGAKPRLWPIPLVALIYLDVSDLTVGRPVLAYIADEIEERVRVLRDKGMSISNLPDRPRDMEEAQPFLRWIKAVRRAFATTIGFLVVLDEVQELLGRLQEENRINLVMDGLRKITNDGGFGLLLCGSVTERKIEALLGDAKIVEELSRVQLGFLGRS